MSNRDEIRDDPTNLKHRKGNEMKRIILLMILLPSATFAENPDYIDQDMRMNQLRAEQAASERRMQDQIDAIKPKDSVAVSAYKNQMWQQCVSDGLKFAAECHRISENPAACPNRVQVCQQWI